MSCPGFMDSATPSHRRPASYGSREKTSICCRTIFLLSIYGGVSRGMAMLFRFKKAVVSAPRSWRFWSLRSFFLQLYRPLIARLDSRGQPFLLSLYKVRRNVPRSKGPRITGSFSLPCLWALFGEALGRPFKRLSIQGMQMIYGVPRSCRALFLVFARSKPPTPPPAEDETRALVLDGLKSMLKQREVYSCRWLVPWQRIVNTVLP